MNKTLTFENDAILFLSDARGVYIPRDFAESIKRECVTGISDDDWAILEKGPEYDSNELYWDVWNDVEMNARITDPTTGIVYIVWQDGDCWLVPEDVEIPEGF